ncbi:hypothetical protein FOG51_02939 [Hanseniaspora uvarum]|jgi:small nuclear ribonucleoprotein (snRNP)-like protein|uniref:U6 snRNA-associated Sm-like protein LSm6 n=1 Tax=Hanseniaspora uvarum TaxID=29833 RepID=A0A1E5RUZ3_HANUV|nr:hypothetical protein FOG48_01255 [Hanseniaspora uvarum]KAF0271558.1 hypothetical protein FOG51_02939 [Hanseniaspora uvarum]KAF0277335.1 hypothetical protein FOG50_01785 [Hanseniaspora uvarum]OEJ90694.1 U6 snRNA-associated Sm-like protein LSm6 [Hanseniaspora uvarum]GMM41504.1 U4/U6-U5 snRNP complex subunit [Hanseniaspora uvarum]
MSTEKTKKEEAATEAPTEIPNNSLISISSFLKQLKGKRVLIKNISGICYKGKLESIDAFMNICLKDAVEYYMEDADDIIAYYENEVFVRGFGIIHMSEI